MTARDPAAALVRAVTDHAARHGVALVDAAVEITDWASATFVGHCHRVCFGIAAGDAAAWVALLPDAEWHLPGRIVVDIVGERPGPQSVAIASLVLVDPEARTIAVDMM